MKKDYVEKKAEWLKERGTWEIVFKKGMEVFEDEDDFEDWMNCIYHSLDKKRPIDFMITPEGRQSVIDVLKRMEYGIYS